MSSAMVAGEPRAGLMAIALFSIVAAALWATPSTAFAVVYAVVRVSADQVSPQAFDLKSRDLDVWLAPNVPGFHAGFLDSKRVDVGGPIRYSQEQDKGDVVDATVSVVQRLQRTYRISPANVFVLIDSSLAASPNLSRLRDTTFARGRVYADLLGRADEEALLFRATSKIGNQPLLSLGIDGALACSARDEKRTCTTSDQLAPRTLIKFAGGARKPHVDLGNALRRVRRTTADFASNDLAAAQSSLRSVPMIFLTGEVASLAAVATQRLPGQAFQFDASKNEALRQLLITAADEDRSLYSVLLQTSRASSATPAQRLIEDSRLQRLAQSVTVSELIAGLEALDSLTEQLGVTGERNFFLIYDSANDAWSAQYLIERLAKARR